ncbi:MAG: hypothetical protein ACLSBH_07305 [Coprobacillus cateniformis]
MKERRGKFLLALALLMTCAAAGTVAQYQTELGGWILQRLHILRLHQVN